MFILNKIKTMSLIEAISAMAIISIVCGGMMVSFYQGSRYLREDQQEAIAFFLAQEKIEELSSSDIFSDLSGCNMTCDQPQGLGLPASTYQNFRINVNASLINTNLANVSVGVFWGRTDDVAVTCNRNRFTSVATGRKRIERFIDMSALVANEI